MRLALALGWAALVVLPLLASAARAGQGGPDGEAGQAAHERARPPVGFTRPRRRHGGAGRPTPSEVAFTCDLVAVATTAGLTPFLALGVAAEVAAPTVAPHLAAVLTATSGGAPLADALEQAGSADPALRPVFELLVTSERSGARVGALFTRLATDERARARRIALARARRVPVRLLFPLVFLLLPSFLVLTVAPVLIAGLR